MLFVARFTVLLFTMTIHCNKSFLILLHCKQFIIINSSRWYDKKYIYLYTLYSNVKHPLSRLHDFINFFVYTGLKSFLCQFK